MSSHRCSVYTQITTVAVGTAGLVTGEVLLGGAGRPPGSGPAHRLPAVGSSVLGQERTQHAAAVGEGAQVRLAEDALAFDGGDFGDLEAGGGDAAVEDGLDLEAVAPEHAVGGCGGVGGGQVEDGEQVGPEGVVAVAQVGVAGAEQGVGDAVESGVAGAAQQGDVVAAAAGGEAGALGEVGAGDQGGDEGGDLGGVGRAVGVEHDDDVSGGGGEPAGQRVALAPAGLQHDLHPGQHA